LGEIETRNEEYKQMVESDHISLDGKQEEGEGVAKVTLFFYDNEEKRLSSQVVTLESTFSSIKRDFYGSRKSITILNQYG
jgi:hypothetical protein